jgi:hypothetical protein
VTQITVTVDEEHLSSIGTVAEALHEQGMQVEQVLDGIGMITGSVPEEQRASLDGVEGVASVDEDLEFRLPPPDSPVQ